MAHPEAMLGVGELKVRKDEAEHEQLHHLSGWTVEGYGCVGGPLLLRFTGFQERHYDSVLPDVRDPGTSIRTG